MSVAWLAGVVVAGWAGLHTLGALFTWRPGAPLRQHFLLPTHGLLGVAAGACLLLGPMGWFLAGVLVLTVRHSAPPSTSSNWRWPLTVTALGLARPWVPTMWDEFVWLGKARLISAGPGAVADSTATASASVIPTGYPPGWPSAVGWLSLGIDDVRVHVVAAGLLLGLTVAAVAQVWAPLVAPWQVPWWAWAAVALTPLPWVHLRSAYVDLPVGLLTAALVGALLADQRPGPVGWSAALALVAFKDEGLAHVLVATLAVTAVGASRWSWGPAVLALTWVAVWRLTLWKAGASNADHALSAPAWAELASVGFNLLRHATDVWSWGLFWPLALAALVRSRGPRPLRLALLGSLAAILVGLLLGTERMRAFAANGTLLNRLLLQLWPMAALVVLADWSLGPPSAEENARRPSS